MTKGQYDYLSKMKNSAVQIISFRSFILVKLQRKYMLHVVLVSYAIGLCCLDFPVYPIETADWYKDYYRLKIF